MLNRTKICTQLQHHIASHVQHSPHHHETALRVWDTMVQDDTLWNCVMTQAYKDMQPYLTSSWHHLKATSFPYRYDQPHHAIGIDGSQIFPQPHQGIHWSVLNTGICHFDYSATASSAHLFSEPLLIEPLKTMTEMEISWQRTIRELTDGTQYALHQHGTTLLLFDGLCIPANNHSVQDTNHISQLVATWHEKYLYTAGYISMPQSRFVSQLINSAAHMLNIPHEYHISDAILLMHILPPYHCSPLWSIPNNSLMQSYFYHTGQEIVRIELPTYITHEEDLTRLHSMITHQILLGYGYPLALAEAHVQATISNKDHDWFHQLLREHLPQTTHLSSKLLRKRCIPL